MDPRILGSLISFKDPGIRGSTIPYKRDPRERRFYIRLARLLLDRSFVLNSNSIFIPY